ncbi:MAG: hypothetical protein OXG16_09435 [Rhodospirillales bacterium]|nr:hypothetical protein [Rhodospirillales bacterium]
MRTFVYFLCAETLAYSSGVVVGSLTNEWALYVWIGLIVLSVLVALGVFLHDRFWGLGPEIRINDTTTYREQRDGSRIVTQVTHVPPVRISGIGTTPVGARATLTVKKAKNRGGGGS